MRGFVTVVCLLFSMPVDADELWLTATLRSYHADRAAGFNEDNRGAGLEYGRGTDWRLVAGTYDNSVRRRSNYAGVTWTFARTGDWRFGGIAGAVSGYPGYRYRFGPMVAPVASWERERIGANFIFLPKIGEVAAVVALQVKVHF